MLHLNANCSIVNGKTIKSVNSLNVCAKTAIVSGIEFGKCDMKNAIFYSEHVLC